MDYTAVMTQEKIMEPHPVLSSHYRSREEKSAFLRRLFDQSAPHYERISKWGFWGTGDWYRKKALERSGIRKGMRVLDVATGTGPMARAIVDLLGNSNDLICVEPSRGMLMEAKKQLSSPMIQGCADELPFRDGHFDLVSMSFALRHVRDLQGSFGQYHRVLKSGGKVLILELTKPENPLGRFGVELYFRHMLPRLTRLLTRSRDASYLMNYYWETLDQMVPPERVLEALQAAGFGRVKRHLVLGIFSEYEGMKE